MPIPESKVLYDPQELETQIIAALTPAQLARIEEYCNISGVTGVTVKAEYGPPAQIYIKNNLGQGAATPLAEVSELAQILQNRSIT